MVTLKKKKVKRLKVSGGILYGYIKTNEEASEKFCKKLANDLQEKLMKNLQEKIRVQNYDFNQFEKDIASILNEYNKSAIGPYKTRILNELINSLNSPTGLFRVTIEQIKGFKKDSYEQNLKIIRMENQQLEDQERSKKAYEETKAMVENQKQINLAMQERYEKTLKETREAAQRKSEDDQKRFNELMHTGMKDQADALMKAVKVQQESSQAALQAMSNNFTNILQQNQKQLELLQAIASRPPPPAPKPRCSIM